MIHKFFSSLFPFGILKRIIFFLFPHLNQLSACPRFLGAYFRFAFGNFYFQLHFLKSGRRVFPLQARDKLLDPSCTLFQSGRRVSNPQPPAWKAGALPIELLPLLQVNDLGRIRNSSTTKWGKMDSNHRSRRQQIYSLPHLATLVLPQNNEPKKGLEPPTA